MTASQLSNQLSSDVQKRIANLVWLESVDSTQNYLRRHLVFTADQDDQPYQVCLADYQTQGRGRRGQRWQALPGDSLLLSLAWSVNDVTKWQGVNLAAAVEAHAVLSQYCSGLKLKWPNDIYHASNKVGGLLVDSFPADNMRGHLIMGIGLNIQQAPVVAKQSVTSLQALSTQPIDRVTLASELLSCWLKMVDSYQQLGFQSWQSYWHSVDALSQRQVEVCQGEAVYRGRVLGINDKAQLILQNDQGDSYYLNSGHVNYSI